MVFNKQNTILTQTRMLAINVSIPNLKIGRLVQFWPWQFDVWKTNTNAHSWLTEQSEKVSWENAQGTQNLQRMATWGG